MNATLSAFFERDERSSYLSLKLFRSSLVTSLRMSFSVYSSSSICRSKAHECWRSPSCLVELHGALCSHSLYSVCMSILAFQIMTSSNANTRGCAVASTHVVYGVLVGAVKPQPAGQLWVLGPPLSLLAVRWCRDIWGRWTNSLKDTGTGWSCCKFLFFHFILFFF